MIYERKIPIDFDCGISIAMEVVFSKWKFCILSQIEKGIVRPKDLVEAVEGVTKRVLHQQLKQLEYYQIIDKVTYAEVPLRVECFLTEDGKRVLPILNEVSNWGLDYTSKYKEIVGAKDE